ncbi:MAG: SGNH/GDSL hydrolase family protein [Sphingobacteriales bacterium]|nr:SGNH/GDSL hydrolase family protein [Sphingobacteriales bacterium]
MRFPLTCLFLLALSCKKPAAVPVMNNPPVLTNAKTWLALGDSYTIGQSVDPADRFPAQTVSLLKQAGINIGNPAYIAATGWTSGVLLSQVEAQNPGTYDVVSLLIGVNDEYQAHDTTGYRQRFTTLLEKSVLLAKGKKENVFVLSIPDYSVTPYAAYSDTARIREEIDWFNAINKNVTDAYQCVYLDITPSTREGRYDRSLIAADGLHPSALEYRKWAQRLAPLMQVLLK